VQVGAVLGDAPDLIQSDFEWEKNSGGGDDQHDDGEDCCPAVRLGEEQHVADDEVLAGGQQVAEHIADQVLHTRGVKNISRQGEQQDHEWEEGEDGVGGDGEGVGVDLSLHEVADERG